MRTKRRASWINGQSPRAINSLINGQSPSGHTDYANGHTEYANGHATAELGDEIDEIGEYSNSGSVYGSGGGGSVYGGGGGAGGAGRLFLTWREREVVIRKRSECISRELTRTQAATEHGTHAAALRAHLAHLEAQIAQLEQSRASEHREAVRQAQQVAYRQLEAEISQRYVAEERAARAEAEAKRLRSELESERTAGLAPDGVAYYERLIRTLTGAFGVEVEALEGEVTRLACAEAASRQCAAKATVEAAKMAAIFEETQVDAAQLSRALAIARRAQQQATKEKELAEARAVRALEAADSIATRAQQEAEANAASAAAEAVKEAAAERKELLASAAAMHKEFETKLSFARREAEAAKSEAKRAADKAKEDAKLAAQESAARVRAESEEAIERRLDEARARLVTVDKATAAEAARRSSAEASARVAQAAAKATEEKAAEALETARIEHSKELRRSRALLDATVATLSLELGVSDLNVAQTAAWAQAEQQGAHSGARCKRSFKSTRTKPNGSGASSAGCRHRRRRRRRRRQRLSSTVSRRSNLPTRVQLTPIRRRLHLYVQPGKTLPDRQGHIAKLSVGTSPFHAQHLRSATCRSAALPQRAGRRRCRWASVSSAYTSQAQGDGVCENA